MSMVTRCPACATLFRITPQVLQRHDGDVRCGHCSMVFNAFDTLATLDDSETNPGGNTVALTESAKQEFKQQENLGTAETADDDQKVSDAAWEKGQTADGVPVQEAVIEGAVREKPPANPLDSLAGENSEFGRKGSDTDVASLLERIQIADLFSKGGDGERRKVSRVWFVGALLLLFLLPVQAMHHFRTELSVLYPGSKPFLEGWCQVLRCTLDLPRRGEWLVIESSDMRADPADASVILLSASITNRAPFSQAFPALELTLTGTQNQTIARQVFSPQEYLPGRKKLDAGIAPNEEVQVNLRLGTADLNPSGYRLYVFY